MKLYDVLDEFPEIEEYMIYDEYANLLLDCSNTCLHNMVAILRNLRIKKIIIKNDLIKVQVYCD